MQYKASRFTKPITMGTVSHAQQAAIGTEESQHCRVG